MNRVHHLEQTLGQNLDDNIDTSTTFLLLDYSSDDGVQKYVTDNYARDLRAGRLKYHHYASARYFSHAHSRNLAVRKINADFICNVDADNFTGKGFDKYLLDLFSRNGNAVVTGLGNPLNMYGSFGRMAVSRDNFITVGGYDECFEGYGFEDYDLVSRLEQNGLEKIVINEPAFLLSIPHDNSDRIAREWTSQHLKFLYRQQVTENLQVLLYLFKDQTFHYGVVSEDMQAGMHYRYHLAGDSWQTGKWDEGDGVIKLQFQGFMAVFEMSDEYLLGNNHCLKWETRNQEWEEAVLFHTNMGNSCRYRHNLHNNIIRVNERGFGEGNTTSLIINN